ncbi:MAG: hypothetical protein QNJ38_04900 [Prochloraceae cyanobacterium]|nr:hypothetical protein [Prochloraceae cyanobacterium]
MSKYQSLEGILLKFDLSSNYIKIDRKYHQDYYHAAKLSFWNILRSFLLEVFSE